MFCVRHLNIGMIGSIFHRNLFKLRLSSKTSFIIVNNYKVRKFSSCPINKHCRVPPRNFSTESSPNIRANVASNFKTPNLGRFIDEFIKKHERNAARNSSKYFAVMKLIDSFEAALNNVDSLKELRDADEAHEDTFKKSLENELNMYKNMMSSIEDEIINELMSTKEETMRDTIVEVTAGVGGQEAMLFAQEIHMLLHNYVRFNDWSLELGDYEITDIGGLRHSVMFISGKDSFKFLHLEAGVHRVQRIPRTEKGGRMHTSTVSVAVYPQPSEIDIDIPTQDLKFEAKTSRGAGGQHVNKIQSACRITHIPTGIVVECQEQRSHNLNKNVALKKLQLKLFNMKNTESISRIQEVRKFQVGTKSRNEKIRTYNYPQDRITDHRFHIVSYGVQKFLEGGEFYQNFIQKLLQEQKNQQKQEFLQVLIQQN